MTVYSSFFQNDNQEQDAKPKKEDSLLEGPSLPQQLTQLIADSANLLNSLHRTASVLSKSLESKDDSSAEYKENLAQIVKKLQSSKHEVQELNEKVIDISSHQELPGKKALL